ncbi:MAG: potassium transporter TrkG [Eubacterium sp.]
MQSKVIFTVALVLIIVLALYLFLRIFKEAWNGMSLSEKIMGSFFSSVTTRTAGFSTVDLSKLTGASQWVMILVMLIGGAPGSTAEE